MKKYILSIFACLSLFAGNSTPVLWGCGATADQIHLGSYASLRVAMKEAGNNPASLIIIIDDVTGGLDPFGSPGTVSALSLEKQKANAEALGRVIKKITGVKRVYFTSQLHMKFSYRSLFEQMQGVRVEDELLTTALYPYNDANQNLAIVKKLKLREITYIYGKDQSINAETFLKIAALEDITINLSQHELYIHADTGNKMGKRGEKTVWLGDHKAIDAYIDELNSQQLSKAWEMLADGKMPSDMARAKDELKEQLNRLP